METHHETHVLQIFFLWSGTSYLLMNSTFRTCTKTKIYGNLTLCAFLTAVCTVLQHFKENLQQLHKLQKKVPQGKEKRGMYTLPLSTTD